MDWRHIFIAIAILAAGIYIGAKQPGLVSKATLGAVSV